MVSFKRFIPAPMSVCCLPIVREHPSHIAASHVLPLPTGKSQSLPSEYFWPQNLHSCFLPPRPRLTCITVPSAVLYHSQGIYATFLNVNTHTQGLLAHGCFLRLIASHINSYPAFAVGKVPTPIEE